MKFLKYFLTVIGSKLRANKLRNLQIVVNYMKLGKWYVDNKFKIPKRKFDRTAVFKEITNQVCMFPVLYLEFGVHKGASMKYWSKALKHKDSILHGFDSFQGLPEDWGDDINYRKGALNVGG